MPVLWDRQTGQIVNNESSEILRMLNSAFGDLADNNLWPYMRDLYQIPGIADTVKMNQIKAHYYRTHPQINPSGLVPLGPNPDFAAPHGRG